jgi:hypothetical protein
MLNQMQTTANHPILTASTPWPCRLHVIADLTLQWLLQLLQTGPG